MVIRKVQVSFLIFVSIFASSCAFQEVTVKKFGGVKVKKFTMKDVTVGVNLIVDNPNSIGFKIYKSNLNIKVNSTDLGTARIVKNVKIKRKGETSCDVELKANLSKLGPAVMLSLGSVFGGGGQAPLVEVSGEIRAGNLFYRKKIPVNLKERVSLGR